MTLITQQGHIQQATITNINNSLQQKFDQIMNAVNPMFQPEVHNHQVQLILEEEM